MLPPKTSIEFRSKSYDPNIARKYKGINLRKAKELIIDDEILERIFNFICSNSFFDKIIPNFTEANRNVSVEMSRSRYIDVNRIHEGFAEEGISFEFMSEFTRKLILEVMSLAQRKTLQYKTDGFICDALVYDLLKKVSSGNMMIVPPLIGTFMQANGIIDNIINVPELVLMPTNIGNVFIDTMAVRNSVLTFDSSKVIFDFSEITMFQYRSNKTEDEDPVRIKVEGGIHPRIESYNANINETVYDLLDVSPRPWSEVYG